MLHRFTFVTALPGFAASWQVSHFFILGISLSDERVEFSAET
jgi:hypothetical protein